MATQPSSINNTPHSAPVGLNGRPASQELFTYNLELALLSVMQRADEYGRDAVFKWRSGDQLYQNAWSTPSYWDWSSSGSYVSESSTPGASTPDESEMEDDKSFEPPRAWLMIRTQIESKATSPVIKPLSSSCVSPLKRKFGDDGDDDGWIQGPPRKKIRCDSKHPIISSLDELTPPSTPLSRARDFLKVVAPSPNDIDLSKPSLSYGEITPPQIPLDCTQDCSTYRRSKRI
ncbi:MAG: hypothetical protein MMC23_006116 [Stictis urceolatum]|nr:hypothetical protein [Stictis urceolata]